MPIWGFYDKTNNVILTCTSDDSLPSSPLRRVAVVELGTLVPMVGVKMSYMSVGVNKGMG